MFKIGYFNNMVDKFLHKIDLDALQKEVGKTIDEIGALIEMKNPKGIYNWAKGQDNHGTRPSYNALIRLLLAGATTKTLFGVDSPVNKINPQGPPPEELERKPIDFDDPEFQALVKESIVDLKRRGQI